MVSISQTLKLSLIHQFILTLSLDLIYGSPVYKTQKSIQWIPTDVDFVVPVGTYVKFMCRTLSTTDTILTKIWLKNETQINIDNKYWFNSNTLTIYDLNFNDSGIYSCITLAGNNNDSIRVNYTLDVIELPPKVYPTKPSKADDTKRVDRLKKLSKTKELQDNESIPRFTNWERMSRQLYHIPSGESHKLLCPSSGVPTPTIKWFKNGILLNGTYRENGESMSMKKWSLSMSNMAPADSGNYTCVVSNKNGDINHTYIVYVNAHRPVFETHEYPLNQTLILGEKAIFDCIFKSDLESVVDWYKMITDYNRTIITLIPHNDLKYEGTHYQRLVINNLTFEDTANYSCSVENFYGTSHKNFSLKVVSDDPIVEYMPPMKSHLLIIVSVVMMFAIIMFTIAIYLKYRGPKNVTVMAQTSYIIKKKIILEKPDSDKSSDFITPLVKIDYQAVEVDSNTCQMNGMTSQYELPLDPDWEVSRDGYEYLDLNIPIIETPPSSEDEEEEDEEMVEENMNSDDLEKHQQMVFQRNIENKCYDLTELEIRTKYLSETLNLYHINREDFV
ncbi:unnamed protein product [Oppiella nova]|uniref:Ig-like domain-containing protein n=1 Tax=Oppiella nova TaxID=334625 RepID=A0A7R9LSV9_9ACAR|nr:unnamed protein product [Oppiella nova]CAG2166657.1 unnamed protein product [Oppiella nova]